MVYTALQAIIAALLFQRMRRAKVAELRFVFLAFAFAALAAVLGILWTGFRILLNPPVAILILPFVRATFYRGKPSRYKQLFAASIGLYAYSSAARLAWQFAMGERGPDAFYVSYLLAILAIFVLCYGWFLVECARAYQRIEASPGIEPWVKLRYVLLGISCAFAIATAVFPLMYPSQESFHEQAAAMKMVMAASNACFSVTSIFAWFVPARLRRYLNKRGHHLGAPGYWAGPVFESDIIAGKLGSTLVMSIIEHLGNRLAPRINKSPSAVKGLLLVSLQAAEQRHGFAGVDFEVLHDAIVEEVKDRLEQLGVPDVERIVDGLNHDVLDIQSLLVVGRF